MKTIAVILAGGTGSRMGRDLPKQFLTVNGHCIIEYTINAFHQHPKVDEVCVVVHPDWINHLRYIASDKPWHKLHHIIEGGAERYLSSLNAIRLYQQEADDTIMLFHDAARPAVSAAIINRTLAALQSHDAVGVGIPTTDTLWEATPSANEEGHAIIKSIPQRAHFWRAQTPQGFRLHVIRQAYHNALQDTQLRVTDDCGVVQQYLPATPIAIVQGDESNIKITYPRDLDLLNL